MNTEVSMQVWHFYFGRPVIVTEISLEGKLTETTLGADIAAGQKCQYTVPPGVWFGARSKEPDTAPQGPLGQMQEVRPKIEVRRHGLLGSNDPARCKMLCTLHQ